MVTTHTTQAPPGIAAGVTVGGRRRPPGSRLSTAGVAVLAVAGGLAWVPYLSRPLSSDEGGFLLVASQWSPGTSLYGDYWVDRPPLLIGLFQLADLAGGAVALRLLGIAAVVGSVLLAGLVGRIAAPAVRAAPVLTAATAAIFLSTPLFGAGEVDGELLAAPFVLAGLVAVLRALGEPSGPVSLGWWSVAAGLAVGAGAVKQSMLDVFVAAAVGIAWLMVTRRRREAARGAVGFAVAALVAGTVLVWWAAARGTGPGALWDAVVAFRARADAVISASATSSTDQRAHGLVLAFLLSGAGALLAAAVVPDRRHARGASRSTARPEPAYVGIRGGSTWLLAAGVLAWELFAVAGGGSFWLHYLIGTVPGLVLTVAAVAAYRPARLPRIAMALGCAVVSASVAMALADGPRGHPTDLEVEQYLAAHSTRGDTAVMAFGDPAILEGAHLGSPYPELWSLPVRVRDPRLTEFARVLDSRARPTWVVVDGTDLATWGVDATVARPILEREYHLVQVLGAWHLYRLIDPPPTERSHR